MPRPSDSCATVAGGYLPTDTAPLEAYLGNSVNPYTPRHIGFFNSDTVAVPATAQAAPLDIEHTAPMPAFKDETKLQQAWSDSLKDLQRKRQAEREHFQRERRAVVGAIGRAAGQAAVHGAIRSLFSEL